MNEQRTLSGFPVYVAGSTDAARAVIVIQEAFGVNSHIRSVADRFAEAGYLTIAPHLYHRDGSPEVAYDDFPSAMKFMANLNAQGITNDLVATTDLLASLGYGAASTGVVGYCMGGTVSFFAATLAKVGASVSFYGGGIEAGRFGLAPLLEMAAELQCPWLGLYGDLDAGILVAQVEALRVATARSKFTTEIVRYPDADHGFHCDGRQAVYNETAARDAHQRTLEFFAQHLKNK